MAFTVRGEGDFVPDYFTDCFHSFSLRLDKLILVRCHRKTQITLAITSDLTSAKQAYDMFVRLGKLGRRLGQQHNGDVVYLGNCVTGV